MRNGRGEEGEGGDMLRWLVRSGRSERWADGKAYAVRCWLGCNCKRQPLSNMHTGKRFAAADTYLIFTSSLPRCAREVEHCCCLTDQTKSSRVQSNQIQSKPIRIAAQIKSSRAMHSTYQPAMNNKHQTVAPNSYDSTSRLPPQA